MGAVFMSQFVDYIPKQNFSIHNYRKGVRGCAMIKKKAGRNMREGFKMEMEILSANNRDYYFSSDFNGLFNTREQNPK